MSDVLFSNVRIYVSLTWGPIAGSTHSVVRIAVVVAVVAVAVEVGGSLVEAAIPYVFSFKIL